MPLRFALHTDQNAPNGAKAGCCDYLKEGDGAGPFVLDIARIEPTAIPTPFARGHAMAAALRLAASAPAQHAHWRTLLLGISLGHLDIDVVDLRDPATASARVRTALQNADPDQRRRYLGLLRTTSKDRATVGGTDPESLLWPSPRRFDSGGIADATWSALRTAVDGDARRPRALQMWWGVRRQLQDAGWWDDSSDVNVRIPWMRAVDWLLDGVAGDGDGVAALGCRGVGPLRAAVADPSVKGGRRVTSLYLPVLDDTIAKDLLDACMLGVEQKDRVVELKDAVGRVARTVRLPVPVGDAQAGDIGAGVVSARSGALGFERPAPRPLQLERWFDAFSALYNSVTPAILEEQRQVPLTAPDPIRLVTLRLGDMATKSARPITYSRRAIAKLFLDDKSGRGRLPPASAFGAGIDDAAAFLDAPRLGAVLSLEGRDASGATRATDAVFVERWGPQGGGTEGAVVEIGDLSAVGAALWAVFSGDAELDAASGKLFFNSEELRLLRDDRPFELTDAIREQLMALATDAARRLATLQRFVAAYPAPIEAGPTLPRLCWLASRVFARRAFGSEPRAQGSPVDPARAVKATVWPGITLSLPVSEDARG